MFTEAKYMSNIPPSKAAKDDAESTNGLESGIRQGSTRKVPSKVR
jgi:hypothetical protein